MVVFDDDDGDDGDSDDGDNDDANDGDDDDGGDADECTLAIHILPHFRA